jgi:serine/threonine-protein kinase
MRTSRVFLGATVAIVAALVLSGCGPKVPNVVGKSPAEAVRILQAAGYKLGDTSTVATDGVPLGMVAAQNPAANERAREGVAVALAVSFSDGTQSLVPNLAGLTQVTAESVVTASELVPLVTEQYSDTVADGMVAAQSPEPSAQVSAGSTVVIVVSKGKEPEKAKVPDVKGDSEADATSAIEKAGFKSEVFKVYDSDVAKGKVGAQLPDPGDTAKVGSTVQIVVSLGKGTGAATVPSVKGKKEADAISVLEDAGFKVQKVTEYSSDVAKGVVSAQFPDSGATAAKGSEVLIVVSKGAEPAEPSVEMVTVPDVVGEAQEDGAAQIEDAGLLVTVQPVPSEEAVDSILYQFPDPGTKVAPGTDVLIVVGAAP